MGLKFWNIGLDRSRFGKNVVGFISTIIFSIFILHLNAQVTYSLNTQSSSIKVTGTSTIHDWEMSLTEMNCLASFKSDSLSIHDFVNVIFSAKSEKLKSESSMMDDKAHEALKTKQFPLISFQAEAIKLSNIDHKGISGSSAGSLTIAGVTKKIQLQFIGTNSNNAVINIKGNIPMKMSDFGVIPPKLMMGTLKTGDDIVINYSLEFRKN